MDRPASEEEGAGQIEEWTEFHRVASAPPDQERQVFDLLWYHGLTQDEAAKVLGIGERTLRSLWRDARLQIHRDLGGRLPGI